jgi:hypothetical protein
MELVKNFIVKREDSPSAMSYESNIDAAKRVALREAKKLGKVFTVYEMVAAFGPTHPPVDSIPVVVKNYNDLDEDETEQPPLPKRAGTPLY